MSDEILLVTSWDPTAAESISRIGEKLDERGYSTIVFSPIAADLRASGFSHNRIFGPGDEPADSLPSPDEIEEKYALPSLRHLYFTDMKYFALQRSAAIRRTQRFAAAIEELFDRRDIGYAFQGRGGEVHRLLVHHLLATTGGSTIWGEFSPFDDRVAFSTHLDGTWDAYETIHESEISPADKRWIAEFVGDFLEEQKVFTYDRHDSRGIRASTLQKTIGRLRRMIANDSPSDPIRSGLRETKTQFYESVNRVLLPSTTESKNRCLSHRYVFFPLQYPIESRLTVFSPEFYDQLFLIEYVSRILPHGVKLFVKQHPNHVGQQSPSTIRRLARKDNVSFLSPSFNAHEAIEHADAVLVTNNTVGFETLFHRTPLVVLGRAFYEDVPAAIRVDELSKLPQELAAAIDGTISEEAVLASVYSLYTATYPGKQIQEAVMKGGGHLDTLVDSLISFMNEYA